MKKFKFIIVVAVILLVILGLWFLVFNKSDDVDMASEEEVAVELTQEEVEVEIARQQAPDLEVLLAHPDCEFHRFPYNQFVHIDPGFQVRGIEGCVDLVGGAVILVLVTE